MFEMSLSFCGKLSWKRRSRRLQALRVATGGTGTGWRSGGFDGGRRGKRRRKNLVTSEAEAEKLGAKWQKEDGLTKAKLAAR